MKAQVIIPKGWRVLRGGTLLQFGDRCLVAGINELTWWENITERHYGLPLSAYGHGIIIRPVEKKKAKHK